LKNTLKVLAFSCWVAFGTWGVAVLSARAVPSLWGLIAVGFSWGIAAFLLPFIALYHRQMSQMSPLPPSRLLRFWTWVYIILITCNLLFVVNIVLQALHPLPHTDIDRVWYVVWASLATFALTGDLAFLSTVWRQGFAKRA
jgi:hypothetical protein